MANRFHKQIDSIEGVGVGRTATIKPQVGPRYLVIWLFGQAPGQVLNEFIEYVEIEISAEVFRRFTPDELEREMARMGEDSSTRYQAQNNTAGSEVRWPIYLEEPWRKGVRSGRALGWPTADIPEDEFIIRVKFKGTAHASVTLQAEAEYDNPTDSQGNALAMGEIIKIYEDDIQITGSDKTVPIPRDRGDLLAVTLIDADIDRVILEAADIPLRDYTERTMSIVQTGRGMTPANDDFHIALDLDDDTSSALPVARLKKASKLKLELGDATPRNIRTIWQFIGPR